MLPARDGSGMTFTTLPSRCLALDAGAGVGKDAVPEDPMSQSEIERFVADLNADAALRAEASRMQPEGSSGLPLDAIVSFAMRKGYAVTAEAVIALARAAQVGDDGKRLTDAELDGVAGGGGDSFLGEFVYVPTLTFVKEHIPIDIVRWECTTELVPVPVSLSAEEFIAPATGPKDC